MMLAASPQMQSACMSVAESTTSQSGPCSTNLPAQASCSTADAWELFGDAARLRAAYAASTTAPACLGPHAVASTPATGHMQDDRHLMQHLRHAQQLLVEQVTGKGQNQLSIGLLEALRQRMRDKFEVGSLVLIRTKVDLGSKAGSDFYPSSCM
eukprot:jgi/Chrzof1/15072/Cz09g26060.t1